MDLSVYVVALQRHAASPARGRIWNLDALVGWVQASPLTIQDPLPSHEVCILVGNPFRRGVPQRTSGRCMCVRALRGAVF
eukprot:6409611-Pyramimonas_sp.AAC.1